MRSVKVNRLNCKSTFWGNGRKRKRRNWVRSWWMPRNVAKSTKPFESMASIYRTWKLKWAMALFVISMVNNESQMFNTCAIHMAKMRFTHWKRRQRATMKSSYSHRPFVFIPVSIQKKAMTIPSIACLWTMHHPNPEVCSWWKWRTWRKYWYAILTHSHSLSCFFLFQFFNFLLFVFYLFLLFLFLCLFFSFALFCVFSFLFYHILFAHRFTLGSIQKP